MIDIERAVLENLQQLFTEKQQEVLDFTEFLKQNSRSTYPEKTQTTQLNFAEKAEKWRNFLAALPKSSANLPDEALHRDTIYDC
jgi:hypothetical protein